MFMYCDFVQCVVLVVLLIIVSKKTLPVMYLYFVLTEVLMTLATALHHAQFPLCQNLSVLTQFARFPV